MQVPPWLLSVTACFYINKCIQPELCRAASPLLILPPPSGAAEPLRDSWEVRITNDLKKHPPPSVPERLTLQLNSKVKTDLFLKNRASRSRRSNSNVLLPHGGDRAGHLCNSWGGTRPAIPPWHQLSGTPCCVRDSSFPLCPQFNLTDFQNYAFTQSPNTESCWW